MAADGSQSACAVDPNPGSSYGREASWCGCSPPVYVPREQGRCYQQQHRPAGALACILGVGRPAG